MLEKYVNKELENILKELVVGHSRCCADIFLEENH
jgi:hypothetical protein